MKKICLLLALIMTFCFVVGCTGADNNVDDDDAEETKVKKKQGTTDDSEYDSYYIGEETVRDADRGTTKPSTEPVDNESAVPKISIKDVEIGECITLGRYEQDNNFYNGNEDIEWIVLDIQDGKALVISKYVLNAQPYNIFSRNVIWETCTLRQWLNEDFLDTAFTVGEKEIISTTKVEIDDEPYTTAPVTDTQGETALFSIDKIFLLSIDEAYKYFGTDSARQCKPTANAVLNGTHVSDGNCAWWLRSCGTVLDVAAYVETYGDVEWVGAKVENNVIGVRPVM